MKPDPSTPENVQCPDCGATNLGLAKMCSLCASPLEVPPDVVFSEKIAKIPTSRRERAKRHAKAAAWDTRYERHEDSRRAGVRQLIMGVVMTVIGVSVTVGTNSLVKDASPWLLFYGLSIAGGIATLKGLFQVIRWAIWKFTSGE